LRAKLRLAFAAILNIQEMPGTENVPGISLFPESGTSAGPLCCH
jgi:hypothetical protein